MYEVVEEIIPDSGRMTALWARDKILEDVSLLPLFVDAILADIYPLSMRAARVFDFVVEQNNHFFSLYEQKLVAHLADYTVVGVVRSLFRIFVRHSELVSPENHGLLIDYSFDALISDRAITIKAYSIDFLVKMVQYYPEITNELCMQLEIMLETSELPMARKIKKTLEQLM